MKKPKTNFLTYFSIIAVVTLLLDQITKYFAVQYLIGKDILITNFFSLSYTTNPGISFGLLQNAAWLPTMVAILVVALIPYFYEKIPKTWMTQIAVAFILAGAAGNLLDRINYGAVVDFIALSFWPTFNVADSAITIGGILFIWDNWNK